MIRQGKVVILARDFASQVDLWDSFYPPFLVHACTCKRRGWHLTWLTVRLFLSSSSYYSLPLYKGEKSLVPNDRHNFSLLTKSQEVSSDRINGQMSQRIFLLQDSFHEVTTHPQTKTQCNQKRAQDITYVRVRYRLAFLPSCAKKLHLRQTYQGGTAVHVH